jgi:hypothetical protein
LIFFHKPSTRKKTLSKKNFAQGPLIEHVWSSGATKESMPLTGAKQRELTLSYPRDRVGNRPLKATGLRILIEGTNTAAVGTTDINPPEYGQLLDYVELDSKILGLLADKNVVTGPVLCNFITPMLRRGKMVRGPVSIPGHAGETGTTVTYFKVEFELPFTNESAARPIDTARLLAELQGSTVRIAAGAAGALGVGHTLSGLLCSVYTDTVIDHGKDPWELGAVLNFTRYMRTANAGTSQIIFDNVGKGTGASGCNTSDGSRFVSAVLMGSVLGLPGPSNFTDVTRFGVPALFQDDSVVPELVQSAMVDSLDLADPAFYTTQVNKWPLCVDLVEGSPYVLNSLPFLLIAVSGADVKASQLPRIADNLTINLVKVTMPGSGQWYLYAIELRDYQANLAETVIKSLGFTPNDSTRKTLDGADPKSDINTGKVAKKFYQGTPISMG